MLQIFLHIFFSRKNIQTSRIIQDNQYTMEIFNFVIANLCSMFKRQKFVGT